MRKPRALEAVVEGGLIRGLCPLDLSALEPVLANTPSEIDALVARARAAQGAWGALPPRRRARLLLRARARLLEGADRLARALALELGLPLADAMPRELLAAAHALGWIAGAAPRALRGERLDPSGLDLHARRARVERVPYGVVGVLAPSASPVLFPARAIGEALAAGNAVVFKPSERATRVGAELHALLAGALPEGLLGLVQGGAEAGEALLRAGLDRAVFGGRRDAATRVAALAADAGVPLDAAARGKDAALVLADADLWRTAHGLAWAAFAGAGQPFDAVERIYATAEVAVPLAERLIEATRALRVWPDAQGAVDVAPVLHPRRLADLEEQLADARALGARVLAGGEAEGPGLHYAPTVVVDARESMRLMREETPGPVVAIRVVADDAEALRLLAAGPRPTTVSVWTRDLRRGARLARRAGAACAMVNQHAALFALPQAPVDWGGGAVRGGAEGIRAMTRPVLLLVDRPEGHEPWWFPYPATVLARGRGLLGALADAAGRLGRRG